MNQAALCIGINYIGTGNALSGCIKDANNIKNMLIGNYNFSEHDIQMLTDETAIKPTKINILKHLMNLAIQSQRGLLSFVFISYSGHGSHRMDINNDEGDGRDELLVPLDFDTSGPISDDELNVIMNKFDPMTRVICLFDSCHSGTILDLKYKYIGGEKMVVENINAQNNCRIVSLSGCLDPEYSYETIEQTGAFTSIFLMTLEKYKYQINLFTLLKELNLHLSPIGQHPVCCTSQLCDSTTIFSASKQNAPFLFAS